MSIFGPLKRIISPLGNAVVSTGSPELGDWWKLDSGDAIAAYQAVSSATWGNVADKAASLINLANPGTYDLTENGTVSFGSSGWGGFSISDYLNTGLEVQAGYSMLVQFSDGISGSLSCPIGTLHDGSARGTQCYLECIDDGSSDPYCNFICRSYSNYALAIFSDDGAQRKYTLEFTSITPGSALAAGNLAICGTTAYQNGSSDGSLGSPTYAPNINMTIGVAADSTSYRYPFVGEIQAVAIFDYDIGSAGAATIAARMAQIAAGI